MKSFLFNEDYLFLKPHFLNIIVLGAEYKNLCLKVTDNSNKDHFIHLKSLNEYFYKNKTMLIFTADISEDKYYLNEFIKLHLNNISQYSLNLTNDDFFKTKFIKDFKITSNNFDFIFIQKDNNKIEIKFYLLVNWLTNNN